MSEGRRLQLEDIDDARRLLRALGAPERLVRHGELVAEAAQLLLAKLAAIAGEPTTVVSLPMALVPTFVAPLFINLHLLALLQLRSRKMGRCSASLTRGPSSPRPAAI